ncbi:PREDICTED: activating signal cointegrator 1 isoform X2 [Gavialis gangeticus]|uniref:activating signal cointegrator 1 isoform X2 n=1 Tax=Gavialis gangeticus TaxID=94835 RepID=UPI00092FAF3C|nr:PREDICTED: activating signal cointegrator 1 isoform X2 [Gavialis gangeticus]
MLLPTMLLFGDQFPFFLSTLRYILSIENEEEIREYVIDLIQGADGKKSRFIEELVARWQKSSQPASDTLPVYRKKDETSEVQRAGDQAKRGRRKGRNKQETPVYAEPDVPVEEVKTPLDLAKVCTKEEQEILQRDSNKSQKLLKKLMAGSESSGKMEAISRDLLPRQEARLKAGLEMAVKHKDKLLEFDKTSVRRTHVIDDESDYFATDSNQWLSKQEREVLQKREKELRELRHASRLTKKITIDFAGRQILEEEDNMAEYHSKLDETIEAVHSGTLSKSLKSPDGKSAEVSGVLVNPYLLQPAPLWVDQTGLLPRRKITQPADAENEPGSERSRLRIQDRELQEISDDGWCLSMHQPWASLLIRGIKRVEGRTWYTSHRGRLWIAATAKRPSLQEISEVEAVYRMLHQKDVVFPTDYPSGCLLGCVDLTDCLSQEQFKEQYPDLSEESRSPFVFICAHAQEMIVKFPIKGKHKIWKLDSKIHQGAKKGLMKQKALL